MGSERGGTAIESRTYEVTAYGLVAAVLWIATVTLLVLGSVSSSPLLFGWGLAASSAAATASARAMIARAVENVRNMIALTGAVRDDAVRRMTDR
jgi:hypothetical protein